MKTKYLIRIVSFILILTLLNPIPVIAAVPDTVEPMASDYLAGYGTYICPVGNYDIQIWWNVIGTGGMADIGTLSIYLYKSTDNVNWTWIKTYTHDVYTQMLDHNTGQGIGYVPYYGSSACYYKAYVVIHAGDGTNGDNRYVWTTAELATP